MDSLERVYRGRVGKGDRATWGKYRHPMVWWGEHPRQNEVSPRLCNDSTSWYLIGAVRAIPPNTANQGDRHMSQYMKSKYRILRQLGLSARCAFALIKFTMGGVK